MFGTNHSRRAYRVPLALAFVALLSGAVSTGAQTPSRPAFPPDTMMLSMMQTMRVVNAESMAPLVNALISDTGSHMRMAPSRVATSSDTARAAAVVRTMRESLAPYADVAVAERDGYVKFLPWLPDQVVYHYNHLGNALASMTKNDIAKPSSLLYRKDATGRLKLIGAMYTAPGSVTPDDLDARLPKGFAQWHAHVNFCGPRIDPRSSTTPPADSATFARWLAIDTKEACAKADGVFVPQLFGWMAHVNAFDGETPAAIWGGHGGNQMHRHGGPLDPF